MGIGREADGPPSSVRGREAARIGSVDSASPTFNVLLVGLLAAYQRIEAGRPVGQRASHPIEIRLDGVL